MKHLKQFITLSLVTFFLVGTGCQSENKKSDSKANSKEGVSTDVINNPGGVDGDQNKVPKLKFEKGEHDFGKIAKGEKVAHSFKFTNDGNAPLVISSANPSCGCTVPNYPKKPVKPGESGFIDVVFDSEGRKGTFSKSVTIMANNSGEPKKLYIKGTIQP